MTAVSWHIGLDSGGSKTELLAVPVGGGKPVRLSGPSAHVQHMSSKEAARTLAQVVHQFLNQHPESTIRALCAGVAGAGRPHEQIELAEHLREALDAEVPPHLRVVHDGVVALEAAFEGESGVITISGTGSLVLARTKEGALERAGGWGHLLGDDGSGHSLGRRGLRAVAAMLDGGPATRLRKMFAERYDVHSTNDLIDFLYPNDWPMQRMAPLVIEAAAEGDEVAQQLIEKETRLLARQVRWLVDRASPIAPQIAPLGGLTNEVGYRTAHTRALHDLLPGWTVHESIPPPVQGALWMAQKLTAASG